MERRIFLGLGSNVGDRVGNILRALELVRSVCRLRRISTVYESDPWGVEDQPPFLNCVAEVETDLGALQLLGKLKSIEREVGRRERFRWGPREIDIDILLYGDLVLDTSDLRVPHPGLTERDFALIPLLEIAPDLRDPRTGAPYRRFREGLRSTLRPFCCVTLRIPWS